MPVFNDIGFYMNGGYNPYAVPYSPPSRSGFLSFSPPTFNKPSIIPNSGFRYRPEPMKFNPPYSGCRTMQFPGSPFVSNYTTYSDWKENLLLNKLRDDKSYRWKDKARNNIYRPNRPIFVDTSKIDVSRPKPRKEEVKPESEKENKLINDGKDFSRDDPMKGTIKRGRTVVRIHTTNFKENPYFAKKEEEFTTVKSKSKKQSSIRQSKKRASSKDESESESNKDDDNDDDSSSVRRDNTVKKRTVKKKGKELVKSTNNEEGGLIGSIGTIVRKCKIRKRSKERRRSTDSVASQDGVIESRKSSLCPPVDEKRRLSMELFEEQAAILDNLIKQELDRKDADDYFSDPKRGTVKISCKQRLSKSKRDARKKTERELYTESSTTDDDLDGMERKKRVTKKKSRGFRSDSDSGDSSSSSRRNSLFQDLFLEATIAENTLGELEDQAELVENKKWDTQQKAVQHIKTPTKEELEEKHKTPVISAIIEIEEKPKTPKLLISTAEVISAVPTKFNFDVHSDNSDKEGEYHSSGEGIPRKQDTVIRKIDKKAKSLKKAVIDRFKKTTTWDDNKFDDETKGFEKAEKKKIKPKKQDKIPQEQAEKSTHSNFQKVTQQQLDKNTQQKFQERTQQYLDKSNQKQSDENTQLLLDAQPLEESTPQQFQKRKPPQPDKSTWQPLQKSTLQRLEESSHKQLDKSTQQRPNKSTPQQFQKSPQKQLNENTQPRVDKNVPQKMERSALQQLSKNIQNKLSEVEAVNNKKNAEKSMITSEADKNAGNESKTKVTQPELKILLLPELKKKGIKENKDLKEKIPFVSDQNDKNPQKLETKKQPSESQKTAQAPNSTQQEIASKKPADKKFEASKPGSSDHLEMKTKQTPAKLESIERNPQVKVEQLNWKQQLVKKIAEQKLAKDTSYEQNSGGKINKKNFQKMKGEELTKKPEKKLEELPLVISTAENPELKKIKILTLPQPSQLHIPEICEEAQISGTAEDESSVSETASEGTDSGTETEEETESDDGVDKLRPSYSNDSGFGSAYHKNRTGISF